MKRILLTIALVPLALSMTSFNPVTQGRNGSSDQASVTGTIDQIGSIVGENFKIYLNESERKGLTEVIVLPPSSSSASNSDEIVTSGTSEDSKTLTIRVRLLDKTYLRVEGSDGTRCLACEQYKTITINVPAATKLASRADYRNVVRQNIATISGELGAMIEAERVKAEEALDCSKKEGRAEIKCLADRASKQKDSDREATLDELERAIMKLAKKDPEDAERALAYINKSMFDSIYDRASKEIDRNIDAKDKIADAKEELDSVFENVEGIASENQNIQSDLIAIDSQLSSLMPLQAEERFRLRMAKESLLQRFNHNSALIRSSELEIDRITRSVSGARFSGEAFRADRREIVASASEYKQQLSQSTRSSTYTPESIADERETSIGRVLPGENVRDTRFPRTEISTGGDDLLNQLMSNGRGRTGVNYSQLVSQLDYYDGTSNFTRNDFDQRRSSGNFNGQDQRRLGNQGIGPGSRTRNQ